MDLRNVIALRETWQRTVREHSAFMRDARSNKLAADEVDKRGRIHLLRIDIAFSQLKAAEEYSKGMPLTTRGL